MNTFTEQLAATRANLERLERLAAEAPELVEGGSLVEVTPACSRVFLHAHSEPERDWLALARKHPANWQRDQSASYFDRWDWDGSIAGVEITIIGAEKKPEVQPLFSVSEAAQITERIDKAMAETPIVERG